MSNSPAACAQAAGNQRAQRIFFSRARGTDHVYAARVRDLHIGPLLERIESQGFPV